ncbi:hypothetical protein Sjap_013115 [Stephania japonica]|uniref:Uncharacterized protein n=1 Tax=Stephania japonica TaxID=461633 RepID=A0AAP0IZ31_9MAGN
MSIGFELQCEENEIQLPIRLDSGLLALLAAANLERRGPVCKGCPLCPPPPL